jgi:molybdopterin converting factor subunit 1
VINVTAQYFAVFREKAGQNLEAVATSAATAGELYAEVSARYGFADSMTRCKVAINDELAPWSAPLAEGDVVLFFPPVAGG